MADRAARGRPPAPPAPPAASQGPPAATTPPLPARSPANAWEVELSDEVVSWYARLGVRDRAFADRALDRLAASGSDLGMPLSRSLRRGLHELRFSCEGVQRRITYAVGSGREIVALTTFRKQRGREQREIDRAREALARVLAREGRRAHVMELGR